MRRTTMLILAGTILAPSPALAAETPWVTVEISGYVPVSCRAILTLSATPEWQCNAPAQLVAVEALEPRTANGPDPDEPLRVAIVPLV